MKEELKRELEDFKEPSPEASDGLIKELEEKPPSSQPQAKTGKRDIKFYLTVLGIIFSVFGLALGSFSIWKLLGISKKEALSRGKEIAGPPERQEAIKEAGNETKEIAKAESGRVEISRSLPGHEAQFRLKLANFLIPLDERSFVKVDVYLLFSEKDRYLKAQEREFELRAFFYSEFKRVKAEAFRNEAKMKELEESLTKLLRQRHPQYSPDRIEFEGLILRT